MYNANQQIKRLEKKSNRFKYEQGEENNNDYENQEELLKGSINDIIEEKKLDLTMLISIVRFLSLILQRSWSYYSETHLS